VVRRVRLRTGERVRGRRGERARAHKVSFEHAI
jgi:hypothetical protein